MRATRSLSIIILGRPRSVRELQGVQRAAIIVANSKRITAPDLKLTDALNGLPPKTLKEPKESVERKIVQDVLRRHGGEIASAQSRASAGHACTNLMEKLGIARERL